MVEIKNVHGSEAAAKSLTVGVDTVYQHFNIRFDAESGDWIYDEIQYTLDEFSQMQSQFIEQVVNKNAEHDTTLNTILSCGTDPQTNKVYLGQQVNRLYQILAQKSNFDDETAMEVADLYPEWQSDKKFYNTGDIVKYGVNDFGDTQLYKVVESHISQPDQAPDAAETLYSKIGFKEGYPIWTQPLSFRDAYDKGDVVMHNGSLWVSEHNRNLWRPGVYGWSRKEN